jgi:hypothetical protein
MVEEWEVVDEEDNGGPDAARLDEWRSTPPRRRIDDAQETGGEERDRPDRRG